MYMTHLFFVMKTPTHDKLKEAVVKIVRLGKNMSDKFQNEQMQSDIYSKYI